MKEFDIKRNEYNKKCIHFLQGQMKRYPMLRIEQIINNLDNTKDYYYEEPWDTYERWTKNNDNEIKLNDNE